MKAIEAVDLTRMYGGAAVVDGVDLAVSPGETVAVHGPNGAGKTTLWAMLAGIVKPSSGTVRLLGKPVDPDDDQLKRRLGIVPNHSMLFESLRGEELLLAYARIYGLDRQRADERVNEVLEVFGLEDAAADVITTYSTGMRKRLRIAAAVLHEPEVLLLDDPFDGVDSQSELAIVNVLRELVVEHDAAVFLTSRYRDVAEQARPVRIYTMQGGLFFRTGADAARTV